MKEVHMSHYLEECLARLNRVSIGAGIGTIVLGGIALVVLPALAVIPLVGYLIVMGRQARERAVLHAGLQGEMRLRTYLRRILSDKYTAFYNVPTDRGDLDCLIMGPTGVYAIEAKHHKGVVTCADGTWRQIKIGRKGTVYEGRLNSPVYQLMHNIKYLKRYFGKKWINGIIVFTHPEVMLCVEEPRMVNALRLDELESTLFKTSGHTTTEADLSRVAA